MHEIELYVVDMTGWFIDFFVCAAILVSFNDEDIYLFDSQDDTLPPLHVYRGHRNSDTGKSWLLTNLYFKV